MKHPTTQLPRPCPSWFACFFLLVGGCQPQPPAAPHAGKADLLPVEAYPRIVVERDLRKFLIFGDPVLEVASETRPMSVTVPVRTNSDRQAAYVQYQYFFVDADGRTLSESGWRFQHLPPRWRRDLTATALDTNAVDFRLEVILAR